jgi:hypothetical protein
MKTTTPDSMKTQFELDADGLSRRRILRDEYQQWERRRRATYQDRYPPCRHPLLDHELPHSVSARCLEIIAENKWMRLRKFFKDVSEAQWVAIREHVLERDTYTCGYCRGRAVTADHVIAFANLGSSHPNNLVATCLRCNSSKSSFRLEEWSARRAKHDEFALSRNGVPR